MAVWTVICALAPGLGHLVLRRPLLGATFFTLAAASLNAMFLSLVWEGDEVSRALMTAGAWSAATVWVVQFLHVVYLALVLGRRASLERREALVQEALTHCLHGRFTEAQEVLREALKLCPDPAQPDLYFLLGAAAGRAGSTRKARRYLRRCRRADHRSKWTAEIDRELRALSEPEPFKPTPPPSVLESVPEGVRLQKPISGRAPLQTQPS